MQYSSKAALRSGTQMVRGYNWPTILFFLMTTLGAIAGVPWYYHRFGLAPVEVILTLSFIVTTGLAISVGYHRFFSHASFKARPIIQFFILFFGAGAFEQSALSWSSGHRDHHRWVDTEADPYSIKKGFWYAHIGWMTLWKQQTDLSNAKDLLKNTMVKHQHDYYFAWSFIAGIALPVFLGALAGHALGAFFYAVCFRIFFVHQATFCINSVCHTFGKRTYDIHASARDHWFVAYLTNGEGYHNFHHRFPADYRNGVRWYQWDPSKWTIALLARIGLAWDLKRVSTFSILEAKLAAESQWICERLAEAKPPVGFAYLNALIQSRYKGLVQKLAAWEATVQLRGQALSTSLDSRSHQLQEVAARRIEQAKRDFENARDEWRALARSLGSGYIMELHPAGFQEKYPIGYFLTNKKG